MSYRVDKQVIDTHMDTRTHRHTDTGNDNTRRPKLASGKKQEKLEQLECLSSGDTPHRPMITHTIDQFLLDPKSKQDKVKDTNFKNLPKLQICWSCLIRCVNMKWIWRILQKIQSRNHSVFRRRDGQADRWTDVKGETSIPPFNFIELGV